MYKIEFFVETTLKKCYFERYFYGVDIEIRGGINVGLAPEAVYIKNLCSVTIKARPMLGH
jgi:hypothetical protein